MKRCLAVLLLASGLLLTRAADVSAQLTAAKDGPVVYGHHHVNTTNIDAQKKFFVDTLGGVAIKIGTNNLEIVKFPNVLIFFRQVQAAPGGTRGTTVNHIGFSVPNLRAMVDKVKASGYPMITNTEATPDRQVKDDIAGPPPAGGSSIAFVQAPDDIKVEFVEAPKQTIRSRFTMCTSSIPRTPRCRRGMSKRLARPPGSAGRFLPRCCPAWR